MAQDGETSLQGAFTPIDRADDLASGEAKRDLGTLSDRAYAILEEAIIRGTLAPGARIKESLLAANSG